MKDLFDEIIAATKMILNEEGLPFVRVIVKPFVERTYYEGKRENEFIQYGELNIKNKLDLSSTSARYKYLIAEGGKVYRYDREYNAALSPRERITCVIIEETTHAIAHLNEGYKGDPHGSYYRYLYLVTYGRYFNRVFDMLKSVYKYQNVSLREAELYNARMKRLLGVS